MMKRRARLLQIGAAVVAVLGVIVAVFAFGTTNVDLSAGGALEDAITVRPAQWSSLDGARSRVYYEPTVSEEAVSRMSRHLEAVDLVLSKRFSGLSREPIEVVLLPKAAYGDRSLVLPGRPVWPLVIDEAAEGLDSYEARYFMTHLIPHEWVEVPIGLRLYWRDRHMRWFGDGVAEYAGFLVSRDLDPATTCMNLEDYQRRLTGAPQAGHFDLLADFPVWSRGDLTATEEELEVMSRGYAVSFTIMYELVRNHGDDVLNTLLNDSLAWVWPPTSRIKSRVQAMLGEDGPALTQVPHSWAIQRIEQAWEETCM